MAINTKDRFIRTFRSLSDTNSPDKFSLKSDFSYDINALKAVHDQLIKSLRGSLSKVASIAGLESPSHPENYGFLPGKMFGELSEMHAFNFPSFTKGFWLTEPQVTKLISYIINPAEVGPVGYMRCKTFLTALYAAHGSSLPDWLDLDDISSKLSIIPEQRTTENMAIDICITWTGNDKKERIVLIENKIGDKVRSGQLPTYKKHAEKYHFFDLFLLNNHAESDSKAIQRNKSWKHILWFSLLRNWELILSDARTTDNEEFARMRRSLWAATVEK